MDEYVDITDIFQKENMFTAFMWKWREVIRRRCSKTIIDYSHREGHLLFMPLYSFMHYGQEVPFTDTEEKIKFPFVAAFLIKKHPDYCYLTIIRMV